MITFFFWGIAALVQAGPYATNAAAISMLIGLKVSIVLALIVGIAGFVLGQDRLARLLGVLWGTDKDFNDRVGGVEEGLRSVVLGIPNWVAYGVLGIVILGGYGYLAMAL